MPITKKSIIKNTGRVSGIIVLILTIRVFLFGIYRVDSGSMENTLHAGDLIFVNKLPYGARLPMQPKDIPFLEALAYLTGFGSWARSTHWPYHRMPGISGIKRNDIVVFIHPQKDDYVVKRCTGLPGDSLFIQHNRRYSNGVLQTEEDGVKFSFTIKTKDGFLPEDTLVKYGIFQNDLLWRQGYAFHASLTNNTAMALNRCNLLDTVFVDDAPPGSNGPALFPYYNHLYTRENYGPLVVPAKNQTVKLDTSNIACYYDAIVNCEKNQLRVAGGKLFINNKETDRYTFKMDYYFMMGDNRYHSIDSRYWGFVPENLVIGKVWFRIFPI